MEGKEPENDKQSEDEKGDDEEGKESRKSSGDETEEGSSPNTDTDEEIDTAEIAQEDWIEYIQRTTAEAEEN